MRVKELKIIFVKAFFFLNSEIYFQDDKLKVLNTVFK